MNGLQREIIEPAMSRALFLAHQCIETGDVPVGAVVIDPSGRIIGRGWNMREGNNDPTAHAEIIALRDAGNNLGSWNLSECTLVVTLEPCTMCAGAAVAARVKRVVFGAWDAKAGACGSVRDVVRDARLNHTVEVVPGVMEQEASIQLRGFFAERRRHAQKPDSDFWSRSTRRYPRIDEPEIGLSSEPTPPEDKTEVPKVSLEPRSRRHEGKTRVPPL